MNGQELASDLIKRASIAGADLSEVYFTNETSLNIDVLDQKLESSDTISTGGVALRIIKDGRLGFSYTANLDQFSIEELVSSAMASHSNINKDDAVDLPEKLMQSRAITTFDPGSEKISYNDKLSFALAMEKAAYGTSDKVKRTEKVGYSDTVQDIVIANSKGINISYKKSYFSGHCEVIAEDSGLAETGHWFGVSTFFSKVDPKDIGIKAANRAVGLLGARSVKSGQMDAVFTPYAASIMLEAVSTALSGEAVIKRRSLFMDKFMQRVASLKLSMIDSGCIDGAIGSIPYDAEGTPTGETPLIDNGFLSSYMLDTYTGKKLGKRSTGNSVRHSFKAMPEIGPTNLYIKNGNSINVMAKVNIGILVEGVIGAHTMNPISGDFSIGAWGHLIENGKVTQPVRGITIAGNLIDLLIRVEDVGSDLEFTGNIGSPSLLVSKLSISGE